MRGSSPPNPSIRSEAERVGSIDDQASDTASAIARADG